MDFEEKYDFTPATDGEMQGFEYAIPDGFTAEIKDGKVVVKKQYSEDERMVNRIISYLKQDIEEYPEREERINEMLAYLEKQKEQKPVMWSAYDKATIEYIIEDIKELRDEETNEEVIDTYDRELNLLQCINDSVKLCNYTNPVEWSEEDKEMKLKILKYLSTRCSVIEFEEVENWLNNLSIRPNHWKPSEEQMDSLMRTITWLVEKGNHTDSSTLADLRRELQKLMWYEIH